MPTKAYFDKYPPFPDDIPVAQLTRIHLSKLLANEKTESDAFFSASRKLGFFLLDFEGSEEGEAFLKNAEIMFDINKEVNETDVDEMMKYAYRPPHSLFGYKALGDLKVEDGRPDRFTFYTTSQDDMTDLSKPLSHPPLIESHRAEIKAYFKQAHSIISLVCSHLDFQLHLPPGTFASMQPMTSPSGTGLRMLRYPPQPEGDRRTSLLGHTDIGSLTILFNITGGLQILLPNKDPKDDAGWVYVKPEPGCAIVNLGDAMVEWSGGILRSNMHRVTFAPGEQGKVPRYSLAYLVRPFGDASMKRLAGGGSLIPEAEEGEDNEMNARDWEVYKAIGVRSGRVNASSRGGLPFKSEGEKVGVGVGAN
ncbi:related to gibberellin 20-oxidase [Phialocephala subalpina]|uniref:Related to gibberellin 20-oxidase n=1 Tax=Phialocephala subalpina TaxID=576137 RepID=A0A1L7X327_9HELO|nr:related to gibberellin 20-oxidase [Phialocephala subalpina]